MFLFCKSMACAAYLRELIIFTLIFHIVAINHCESIKSIDNNLYNKITDPKSKQNYITVMLPKINEYSVTVTTMTTKSMASIRR